MENNGQETSRIIDQYRKKLLDMQMKINKMFADEIHDSYAEQLLLAKKNNETKTLIDE